MVHLCLTFVGQLRTECYFLRLFPFRGLWKPWLSSGSSQDSLGRVLRALCELWDVPGEAWEHLQHSGAAQSSIYNYKLPINRTAAVMLHLFEHSQILIHRDPIHYTHHKPYYSGSSVDSIKAAPSSSKDLG